MASQLGFSFPSSQAITQTPKQENEKLLIRKERILTELAALETGISLYDFMNPARDHLQSSVTDVPCAVKMLSVSGKHIPRPLDVSKASVAFAQIIAEIGSAPGKVPLECTRPPLKCDAIVNHGKVFFAQLKRLQDLRSGLKTAFAVIPHKNAVPTPDGPSEEEPPSTKRVHPFFPDVRGLGPLLGHMKAQLGEFPNFVKNPPNDAECEELRLAADPDCLKKHIFEICGSSSDDEFDPDGPLEVVHPPQFQMHGVRPM
jgi:hypothetical protein